MFNTIKEKLPVHAVAVRYLRFSPSDVRGYEGLVELSSTVGISEPNAPALQEKGSGHFDTERTVVGTVASRSEWQSSRNSQPNPPQIVPEKPGDIFTANAEIDASVSTTDSRKSGPVFGQNLHPSVLALLEDTAGSETHERHASASNDLIQAAPNIVQDMATCVAEIVATLYLADIHAKGRKG